MCDNGIQTHVARWRASTQEIDVGGFRPGTNEAVTNSHVRDSLGNRFFYRFDEVPGQRINLGMEIKKVSIESGGEYGIID